MPSKRARKTSDLEDESGNSSDSSAVSYKILSNKTVLSVPPRPSNMGQKSVGLLPKRPFDFQMIFINGVLLRKFLYPPCKAVKKMRFVLCNPASPTAFHGFKIECHDPSFTLADRGLFECDIESGRSDKSIDGTTFCVSAEAFMHCLGSSTQRETDLRITRYLSEDGHEEDQLTFESVNNENDVRARYTCNLLDFSQVETLDGISIDLGFHATVQMSILKELCLNAKNCKARTLIFELWQASDEKNPAITHSKMSVGFKGDAGNASGFHEFFNSMRRDESSSSSASSSIGVTWTPVSVDNVAIEELKMEKKCYNEYDNKKLRKFLNHMECQYVLVHLCTDNTQQPLVLDCVLGGPRTKHTVIVVPRCAE